jgi:hypothetical protein
VFSKWLLVLDYTVNKNYIANTLCENRDKPKLHCNGKCQLAKKIAAEEDQNNKTSSGNSLAKAFPDFCPGSNLPVSAIFSTTIKIVYNNFYLLKHSTGVSTSVFHPPLV